MSVSTAAEIARDVTAQRTSAVRVAYDALERANAVNARLNALTVLNPALIDDAAVIDARVAGGDHLPLAGVPVIIKDNIWVEDLNITNGSRLFADFIAPKDAVCVTRMRDAGALILGIGTCSEFACKGVTNTPLHGITRHPQDTDLTPGGSSGGPAVAVASGIAPVAIGTDAGGSSRRPPAHVGVVGFKPTQDVVPYGPGFFEPVWGISTICPITQNVTDAALVFEVLSGQEQRAAPTDLCFAYAPDMGLGVALDQDVADVCRSAILALSDIAQIKNAAPAWGDVGHASGIMAMQFGGLAALYGEEWQSNPELFDPDIGVQIEMGLALTGVEVAQAHQAAQAMRVCLRSFLLEYDFLITPTTPCVAWPASQLGPTMIGGKPAGQRDHAAFTPQINHAGLPAISIPCGVTQQNLPVGLQIIGSAHTDSTLLAVAQQFETLLQDAGLTHARPKACT